MSIKHSEKYKQIGIRISKYRKEKGLTQEQLANEVGISYEFETLKKIIAEVLGVDVKDLL